MEVAKISLSLTALGLRKLNENERAHHVMRFGLSFVISEKMLESFFHALSSNDVLSEKLEEVITIP